MHRIKSKLTALALCFGVLLALPVAANAAALAEAAELLDELPGLISAVSA